MLYKVVLPFESVDEIKSRTIQMKATEQYFPVVLFIMLYKVVLTFESVDEILKCYHLNESYWAVLFCGTVHYAVQGGPTFWVCALDHSSESYLAVLFCITFFIPFESVLNFEFMDELLNLVFINLNILFVCLFVYFGVKLSNTNYPLQVLTRQRRLVM